jgi:hypothetical protein
LRRWLRRQGVPEVAVPEAAAAEEECEVCGTVPFFAAVRCACSATRLACLHHGAHARTPATLPAAARADAAAFAPGLALCDCPIPHKTLQLRIADVQLEGALVACGLSPPFLAPEEPADGPAKRARADDRFGAGGAGSADASAGDRYKPPTAMCSECGRHAGRGGLLRCMGCDAAFHRKCADADAKRARNTAEVCLCPSCWDAQR